MRLVPAGGEAARPAWPSAGGYQPFAELGRGGMGVAYLARRIEFGRGTAQERLPLRAPICVVKRPHAHLMRDGDLHRRFHHEAALATSVHHPALVETWGAGEDAHGPYLLLEYVHGITLEDLIDRSALRALDVPVELCVHVARRCLDALHALHHARDRRGTPLFAVHRDVSPQNVLLDADGRVKLSDLGVAKSRLKHASTDLRGILGKLQYSAPEYLRERRAGPALDVYALGVTLWTSIAGRSPFNRRNESELLADIMERGVPPLKDVRRDCPTEVSLLVARATARQMEERPTVAQLAEELDRLSGGVVAQGQAGLAQSIERLAGRDLLERKRAWGLGDLDLALARVGEGR